MKINAELILRLRKKMSWSQEELSIATGLNLRTVQRIEKESSASLQSKKALASAFEIDIHDLDYEECAMKPCPECNSEEVYRFNKSIPSYGAGGPTLLPGGGILDAGGTILPVVCTECGYLRYYASKESLSRIREKKSWVQV